MRIFNHRHKQQKGLLFLLILLVLPGCSQSDNNLDYRLVRRLPHDPAAFTQGLLYDDGVFFESTGLRGQSSLRRVDPESGEVLAIYRLADQYFGEGLALSRGVLIQLTWQAGVALFYSSTTLAPLREVRYSGEGWGLTFDGERLIMSDGSSTLQFRDPRSFRQLATVDVVENGQPVTHLNELEYIQGALWANVWQTDRIIRIDPETGTVTGALDLSGLLSDADRNGGEDVLNGIAWDPNTDHLFVTGKLWSHIYEIEILP